MLIAARPPPAVSPTRVTGERLYARLHDMRLSPQWVADIGGDGVFIASCYPRAQVVAVDFSMPVLRAAAPPPPPRLPLLADAEQLPLADASLDLLWSNLCLEWTQPQLFFAEAARVLKPNGVLAFTSLGTDTLTEVRTVFAGENRVHEFPDIHDLGDALLCGGFAEPIMESERLTLTYANADDALRDARNMGAGCALAARPRGLMGRKRWQRAVADYAAYFGGADGRVTATVEAVYATAWRRKSQPQRKETIVQFHPHRNIAG